MGRTAAVFLGTFAAILSTLACGNNDVARWSALESRASELAASEDYDKAVTTAQEAAALAEELFGVESASLAASLNNLGLILRNQGDVQGSEEATLRALLVSESVFPSSHEFVATVRTNLAKLYLVQNRLSETILIYEQLLASATEAYGMSHPSTFTAAYNLSDIYRQNRDFDFAESIYVQTIQLHTEVLGELDATLFAPLTSLGNLYLEMGRVEEANAQFAEAAALPQAVP